MMKVVVLEKKSSDGKKMKIGYYDSQEVFRESIDCIRSTFGLELTIIEKSRLKELVPLVLDERKEINGFKSPHSSFDPVGEITTRFMVDYYGLPLDYAVAHTSWGNAPILIHHNAEFKEYMLRRQKQEHHEI